MNHKPLHLSASRILASVALLFALSLFPAAQAQGQAGPAYDAFNSAYLAQVNGQTYYTSTYTSQGTTPEDEWVAALSITVAEDAYQYNHSQNQRNLVISLLNTLAYYNGPNSMFGNWQTDGWDDNLAWMVNVFLRGYQLTGITSYLTQAEAGWNNGYNQGWDTSFKGGGIWENTDKTEKCALSNDPFVFEGVALYQITGDATYLNKAKAIYSWARNNLVTSSGQVNGCVLTNGQSGASANAYDSGSFLKAANDLYRVTGQQNYYNDAILVADFAVAQSPQPNGPTVLTNSSEGVGNQYAYWLTLGVSQLATNANLWSKYEPWLLQNANAAWSHRNNLNLTWNQWDAATPSTSFDATVMSSAAAVWQHMQPPAVNLTGTYEIQSVASGLAVQVNTSSSNTPFPIVQGVFSGASTQLWTFVATSGGYYQIKNVSTGQVVNVAAASAKNGAAIVQWPANGMIPGNDQWLPVLNSDGSYSFFNLNSLQALDDPNESTQAGIQLDQWFGNSTSAQSFKLIKQ